MTTDRLNKIEANAAASAKASAQALENQKRTEGRLNDLAQQQGVALQEISSQIGLTTDVLRAGVEQAQRLELRQERQIALRHIAFTLSKLMEKIVQMPPLSRLVILDGVGKEIETVGLKARNMDEISDKDFVQNTLSAFHQLLEETSACLSEQQKIAFENYRKASSFDRTTYDKICTKVTRKRCEREELADRRGEMEAKNASIVNKVLRFVLGGPFLLLGAFIIFAALTEASSEETPPGVMVVGALFIALGVYLFRKDKISRKEFKMHDVLMAKVDSDLSLVEKRQEEEGERLQSATDIVLNFESQYQEAVAIAARFRQECRAAISK